MTAFTPGEFVMLDRSLKVKFVRDLGDGNAIIELGGATQVAPLTALDRAE